MKDTKILINEIKQGNVKAFETLFHHYYPRLLAYATRFVSDRDDAGDLVQDSFVKFWEKRTEFTTESITSLLFTIVRNNCLNYLKHRTVVEKYQNNFQDISVGQEHLYHADFLGQTDKKLLFEEFLEQVNLVFDNLPPRCREVFEMSRSEGLKNREIAERLQISVTAVEKHITRAISAFKQHFEKNYPVELIAIFLAWLGL